MYAVIIMYGTRPDITYIDDELQADSMYDQAVDMGQRAVLAKVEKSTFTIDEATGPVPEAVVVEEVPAEAVKVGPGAPAGLPPATVAAPKLTRCERCRRQLMGGVCPVHGTKVLK